MDTVRTIEAMQRGDVKVFVGMGGNFALATPGTPVTWAALRTCDLTVQVSTELNRSHLVHGRQALIHPRLHEPDRHARTRNRRPRPGGHHEHRAGRQPTVPQRLPRVPYDIPRGCAAGYMPEMNVLCALGDHSPQSDQPIMKHVSVTIGPAA